MDESRAIRRPPGPRPVPLAVRFARHVEHEPGDCWRWTGNIDRTGHPRLMVKRGERWVDEYAYRVGWELAHGQPAAGDLRETCGHAWCVNPAHRRDTPVSASRQANVLAFWRDERGRFRGIAPRFRETP